MRLFYTVISKCTEMCLAARAYSVPDSLLKLREGQEGKVGMESRSEWEVREIERTCSVC